MEQFGEIDSCIIKKDNQTGRSRCFGFVVFKEVAGLEKVSLFVVEAKSCQQLVSQE